MAVTSAGAANKRDSISRIVQEARFHEDALVERTPEPFTPEDEEDDVDTDEVVSEP